MTHHPDASTSSHDLREAAARVGESGKTMPIMLSDEMKLRIRRGERFVHVCNVPWELFGEPCDRISEENHGQSLDKIASRGGFDAPEAICILTSTHWRDSRVPELQAHRILYIMTALYRRGALAAEAELATLKAAAARDAEERERLRKALEAIERGSHSPAHTARAALANTPPEPPALDVADRTEGGR
jgi:hypothetical protein